MKFLRRIFFLFLAFFLIIWILDWGIRHYLGVDDSSLTIEKGSHKFSSKRDADGVWQIEAPNEEGLWFALGYIQAHDREFQLELYRQLALGKLSEWMGETFFASDRFNRAISRVAKAHFDSLAPEDLSRRAAETFVLGHNHYIETTPRPSPIEYLVLKLERKSLTLWEPWHVFAISRFQSLQHSFDLKLTLKSLALKKELPSKLAEILKRTHLYERGQLYSQPDVKEFVQSRLGGIRPSTFANRVEFQAGTREGASKLSFEQHYEDFLSHPAELGASNAWISKTGDRVSFCNDPHLRFMWPTPLYPFAYQLGNIHGVGVALPGSPGMVIGKVEHGDSNGKIQKMLSWGMTIGAFADTEDLIALSPKTLEKSQKYNESFVVRNLENFELKTLTTAEEWTDFGPRVDSYLKDFGVGLSVPVAVDWMGFRSFATPEEFFLRRMTLGSDSLKEDLAKKWPYPSVNLTWMEWEKGAGVYGGHVLTGTIFSRARENSREILSETAAQKRQLSYVTDRPYFYKRLDTADDFLLVTANQGVFVGPLAGSLAHNWIPPLRSEQILRQKKQILEKPDFSQSDFYSPSLQLFWSMLSERNPRELCAESGFEKNCLELLYGLSRWNFRATLDSWEVSLLSLWFERVKLGLWPTSKVFENEETLKLYTDWARGHDSQMLMERLASGDKLLQRDLEEAIGKPLENVFKMALQETLKILSENFGEDKNKWQWRKIHVMSWLHPFSKFPAPLNDLLMQALVGLPRSVPGAYDSPGRFHSDWDPQNSLSFPASHGAVLRTCSTLDFRKNQIEHQWSMPAGVSGNPFSKWTWPMSRRYYEANEREEKKDN